MNDQTQVEIEAQAFRRLLAHLDEHKAVQNIDLMNLAGFCRNCLSKWYRTAAEDKGIALDYEAARERIYDDVGRRLPELLSALRHRAPRRGGQRSAPARQRPPLGAAPGAAR